MGFYIDIVNNEVSGNVENLEKREINRSRDL